MKDDLTQDKKPLLNERNKSFLTSVQTQAYQVNNDKRQQVAARSQVQEQIPTNSHEPAVTYDTPKTPRTSIPRRQRRPEEIISRPASHAKFTITKRRPLTSPRRRNKIKHASPRPRTTWNLPKGHKRHTQAIQKRPEDFRTRDVPPRSLPSSYQDPEEYSAHVQNR